MPRVYEARVLGVPDDRDIARLSRGIVIDGQRTAPADVERLPARTGHATLRITLREGRNRQVRKMCEAIGHPVEHLKRVAIGPINDARLRLGQWRSLTATEVARVKKAVATTSPRAAASRDARDHVASTREERETVRTPSPSVNQLVRIVGEPRTVRAASAGSGSSSGS